MLLALLSTTAIYLTPLDAYVPEIEQALTDNFGERVKIQHLKLDALPLPHMTLEGVEIGDKSDLALQSVGIYFDLKSLLKSQRVIRRLALNRGSVTEAQLAKIIAWVRSSSSVPEATLRLEELQLNDIRVVMPGLSLEPMRGQMNFAADSSLSRGWIVLPRQQGVVQFYPRPGGGYQVDAGLQYWSLPGYPDWVADSLSIKGVLAGDQFQVDNFSARMLGAQIDGRALLSWQQDWRVEVQLNEFDGDLERLLPLLGAHVKAAGMLHATGHLEAQSANAHELPGKLGFDLDVGIRNASLRLPLQARRDLQVDSASSHVTGTLQEFKFNKLVGRLYGGTLTGTAAVQRPKHLLDADVVFGNVSLQRLVEALSSDVMLTGRLDGQAKLATVTDQFDHFPANVRLDGRFHAKNGVLRKLDLVQAASNPLKNGNKGGKTSFDELSGLLSVDGNGYHLRQLKVSSGAVHATGRLDISPQLQLNGLLDTDLKGTATLVSMPLVVSGTVGDPVLHPTGSTLAGAAVGTALLGPGLGTALGIKLGNLFHRLFGTKSDKAESGDRNKSQGQPGPAN